jgi:hypothetical protein
MKKNLFFSGLLLFCLLLVSACSQKITENEYILWREDFAEGKHRCCRAPMFYEKWTRPEVWKGFKKNSDFFHRLVLDTSLRVQRRLIAFFILKEHNALTDRISPQVRRDIFWQSFITDDDMYWWGRPFTCGYLTLGQEFVNDYAYYTPLLYQLLEDTNSVPSDDISMRDLRDYIGPFVYEEDDLRYADYAALYLSHIVEKCDTFFAKTSGYPSAITKYAQRKDDIATLKKEVEIFCKKENISLK